MNVTVDHQVKIDLTLVQCNSVMAQKNWHNGVRPRDSRSIHSVRRNSGRSVLKESKSSGDCYVKSYLL